ncbi:MAG: hypothetical protein NT027_12060 [Proteobacteria bacterium]|nr:hypothetical protein [Pseudomonadota bacterium]
MLWKERSFLKKLTRNFFESRSYEEIDTPIAVICPGSEVHLNYFETAWQDYRKQNHQLFLRSSPEIHMKQALIEGVDKIFQIGSCFRNGGELSEWHHPEFTMLEWYETGLDYKGLMTQTEDFLNFTHLEFAKKFSHCPQFFRDKNIQRISVFEAFQSFAKIELIDQDPDLARKCIVAGSMSVKLTDDFETAYFKTLIEVIEPKLAEFNVVFLYDYPPSQAALSKIEDGRACRFECYVGRVEISNGFFELLGTEQNKKVFRDSNKSRLQNGLVPVPEDTLFFEAIDKIKSSYSGNALGFDRWLALLCGQTTLDHVLPFRRRAPFIET